MPFFTPFRRVLAGAISTVTLASLLATAAHAAPMPAIAFPQEHSPFKADPNQVWGRLPNGMSYVIMHHAVPPHTAIIQLRIAAGSMEETVSQRGLAHFVEHMAFEGSTNQKPGDLKADLERKGFTFGADANAVTSANQTLYMLNAPNTQPETISAALSSLREIAGNLTFDATALDHERGVVLSEERARGGHTLADRYFAFVYPAQKYGQGFGVPIGSRDVIQSASRDDLLDFYHAWYRPQLATLVVVGDIDPKAVEAEIKTRFGDWQAAGAMPDEPDWGTRNPRGLQLFEYSNPGTARALRMEWIRPAETRPDTLDRYVDGIAESAAAMLLTRRLSLAVEAKDSPILKASASRGGVAHTSREFAVEVDPKPGQTKAAFDAAYAVVKTFRDQGVTDAEVKLVADQEAAARARFAKSYDSRTNAGIAESIVGGLGDDTVSLDVAGRLAMMDAAMPHLDKAGLNAGIKTVFAGDGPVLSDFGDSTIDFDPPTFKAEYLAQTAAPDVAYAEAASVPWPYTDFGPAKAAVSHTVDKDLGFDHFVFANGVQLNVKQTSFTAGQVEVGVAFLGGMQRFDPKKPVPLRLAAGSLFIAGGLGKLDSAAMSTSLAGKTVGRTMTISSTATTLSGVTTPGDLGTQMQVLMAYATDPGLRGGEYARFQTYLAAVEQKQMRDGPTSMLGFEFESVMHSGDWRFDAHIADTASNVPWSDVESVYRDLLRNDTPIVITMVGDIDPQAAADEVAKTFGTLGPRPATAPKAKGAEVTPMASGGEHVFYHDGRHDLSVSAAVWPTTGYYTDVRASHQVAALTQIIRNRLFDSLREKLGADYSPAVSSYQDDAFPDFGYIRVQAQVRAGDDKLFRDTLAGIVSDLKAHPVSDDELARVKTPGLQGLDNALNTNGYWFSILQWVGRQPQGKAAELSHRADVAATTPADVMALAQRYLKDDREVFIRVVPREAPTKVDDGH